MRCFHCGQKLSLLKLAKGDSFCSPEHVDAYQRKMSEDAFDRIMGTPAIPAVHCQEPPLEAQVQAEPAAVPSRPAE